MLTLYCQAGALEHGYGSVRIVTGCHGLVHGSYLHNQNFFVLVLHVLYVFICLFVADVSALRLSSCPSFRTHALLTLSMS